MTFGPQPGHPDHGKDETPASQEMGGESEHELRPKTPDKDSKGRFQKGNQAARGKGGPGHRRVREFRATFLNAAQPEHIQKAVQLLVDGINEGNLDCAKELLNRCVGNVAEIMDTQLIEALESEIEELKRAQADRQD